VNGRPLNESPLAADPEHPRRSAEVEQLLGLGACPLALVSAADALPQAGLVVPDVANSEELVTRAGQIHGRTLPAGAADFFAALLAANAGVAPRSEPQCAAPCLPTPILLACGSPAAWRGRAGECQAAGLPVVALAGEATSALDPIEAALRAPGVCVVTTVGGDTPPTDTPPMARLADLVAGLVRQARVATLLAEGGATATAVAERLGWARFAVTETAPAGVGVLSPLGAGNAPRFLIKPGSYPWPEAIWSQLSPSR
jgi:hypothetical protein